ncbi:hypothetical protein MRF4_22145 [Methylobacterium radiotolerans]|uniref:hypothetical protein n=1 Tax=Methylobacterium TaxID=407 RepID=UPI002F2FD8F1
MLGAGDAPEQGNLFAQLGVGGFRLARERLLSGAERQAAAGPADARVEQLVPGGTHGLAALDERLLLGRLTAHGRRVGLLGSLDRLGVAAGLRAGERRSFPGDGRARLAQGVALFLQRPGSGLERVDPRALAGQRVELLERGRAGLAELLQVRAARAELLQRLGVGLRLGGEPFVLQLQR